MIQAVIFDMDGVIIDSEREYKRIEGCLYDELGLLLTEEEALQSMGKVTTEWWRELSERFGFEETPETMAGREDQAYLDFLFSDDTEKVMFPDIDALLKGLKAKGVKTAVASSSLIDAIDRVLEIFHLEALFDAKVSGQQVPKGKPAPDVFLKAAEVLEVEPENCLVVEDSYFGIKAAKAAGMICAAYLSAPVGMVDYTEADYQIRQHLELLEIDTLF